MSRMAASVTSVDIHNDFLETARANLEDTGINDVTLLNMDATRELPGEGFDAIAVTGSIENFDPRLVDALNVGGRLFVVVGNPPVMDARLVTKTGDNEFQSRSLFETVLTPLVNGTEPPRFLF